MNRQYARTNCARRRRRKVGVTGLPAPPAIRSAAVSAMIGQPRSSTCRRRHERASSAIDAAVILMLTTKRDNTRRSGRLAVASCQRRPSRSIEPFRRTLNFINSALDDLAATT